MKPELTAPQPLSSAHLLTDFDCGEPVLNDWLRRRALANQASGASRCFVVVDTGQRVLAYYALAAGAGAGAGAQAQAPGGIRRNMPDPIPVMVLGRLAADRSAQGRHLGGALLKDAVLRCLKVAENAGVRALLVHALNDKAREFYAHYGFEASPANPMALMLRLPRP